MKQIVYRISIVAVSYLGTSIAHTCTDDQQAYTYCLQNPQSFIGIVWPITPNHDTQIRAILNKYGSIHYRKNIVLTREQAFMLLQKAHPHIQNMEEHVNWYFPPGTFKKMARIFVLAFNKPETAVACKHAVRRIFKNLQYRSIHINDTHAETIELAQFFFT